jgi:hypothetical protein
MGMPCGGSINCKIEETGGKIRMNLNMVYFEDGNWMELAHVGIH